LSLLLPGRLLLPVVREEALAAGAEWLQREVLESVPHRHVTVTLPRLLRPSFRRRRELLRDLARCASEAIGPEAPRVIEDMASYLVRNPVLCGRPHRTGYADLAIMRTFLGSGRVWRSVAEGYGR